MAKSGRCNQKIRLREGVPYPPAIFHQKSPAKQDFLIHGKNTASKHGPDLPVQPTGQQRLLRRIGNRFNPKANLGERHAGIESIHGVPREEIQNILVRPRAPEFRQDVRIQQPGHQRTTSRTGIGKRSGSRSRPLNGEAWKAATIAAPVKPVLDSASLCVPSRGSGAVRSACRRASSTVSNAPSRIQA